MKAAKKLSLPQLKPMGWKELRQKELNERALEPRRLRIVTFSLTFASMALGMSFIPLFPQPLPILIAFMVAAVSYGYPEVGMPIGCGVIAVGLIYQLSTMNFVSMIHEDPTVRGVFVGAWLVLFIIPPIVFHRQKAALAIDLGIMAAMVLFFDSTFFLAVPLILTSAVLFNRKAALTVLYTVLTMVPLVLMQYVNTIMQITRPEWWLDPKAVPSIYAPLSGIFSSLQTTMLQFRLYDTSKIVNTITNQLWITAYPQRLTVMDALRQYRDSLPGIMLFIAIVASLVMAVYLILKTLTGGSLEKILPVITATTACALFFLCLSILQAPLAISGEVSTGTAAFAVIATVLLTLPTSLITYSPKKKATNEMIMDRAKELLGKLQTFEGNLVSVKNGIPMDVTSVEGKMLIIKDKLNDIYTKAQDKYYDASEQDRKFDELDKGLSVEIDALFSELEVGVREYHTLVNCEYLAWMGKLKTVGLNVVPTVKAEFEQDMPLEARIERVKGMLDGGRTLANDILPEVERIYGIVRSLYDPNLPEQSRAVTFAKEKLAENSAPWVAIDSLLVALNNWRRQYSEDIMKSVEILRESLGFVIKLGTEEESLSPALEEGNFAKIEASVKAAEGIEFGIEENKLNVTEVTVISNVFQSSLNIAKDVLTTLNEDLLNKEKTIETLLPKPDYMWEKNITLKERMATAVDAVTNAEKYGLKQTLQNLPKFLFNVDECMATILAYSERREMLLNYPMAATAIETELDAKNTISARDLPFEAKYSEEFLRLFYSHKYPEFSLDEETMVLARKT